jgi:hypothetical protein
VLTLDDEELLVAKRVEVEGQDGALVEGEEGKWDGVGTERGGAADDAAWCAGWQGGWLVEDDLVPLWVGQDGVLDVKDGAGMGLQHGNKCRIRACQA